MLNVRLMWEVYVTLRHARVIVYEELQGGDNENSVVGCKLRPNGPFQYWGLA